MATRRWRLAVTAVVFLAVGCSDPASSIMARPVDAGLSVTDASAGAGIAMFTAVDLLTAAGLPNSVAEGINLPGIVAGTSYAVNPATDGRVTVWNATGPHDVGVPAGFLAAEGMAINDFGDVVGIAHGPAGVGNRGFIWTPGVGFSILTGPAGATDVQAVDIEDNALTVVGEATVGGNTHAFRWQPGSGYQDLHPAGFASSHADAISPNQAVTGWAKTMAGDLHAVMWSPVAVFTDLGTLPGGSNSMGFDINSAGAVVGQSEKLGGNLVAFMRRFPAVMQGAPFANSAGTGISDLGRMVGWSPMAGMRRAVTKKGNTAFLFLPPLAGTLLSDAREVNRCGHAVGSTAFVNGTVHATRWTNSPCD